MVKVLLTLEDILTIIYEFEKSDEEDNIDKDYVENNEAEFKLFDKVLNLEESFNLNYDIFGEISENNIIRIDNENLVKEQPNYDYNVNSLVDEILLD
ncbi:3350_t:CDS:2 [Scutellospora calospora]|uniref:3350_t:CDS:1 n=1 Tax=Scutellospora calospora TaxID=85575 RepID=A0ACA9JW19_9GLOM|nr:3350_t:CDS:2 [Scutellospora calospora]